MTNIMNSPYVRAALGIAALGGIAASTSANVPVATAKTAPPTPAVERVIVEALPLPPTSPSNAVGACSLRINPRATGCMAGGIDSIIEGPAYMYDGKHLLLAVEFSGAPAAPASASVYTGNQVIAIKTDGSSFPNGDAWKCITCGIPNDALKGANLAVEGTGILAGPTATGALIVDHPQAFPGDRKMIAGTNVIDCGEHKLLDVGCTPDRLKVIPIRWNTSLDGSGPGGSMRELRLNPDGVHLMWSHMNRTSGDIDQHGLVGRLRFNRAPKTGAPLVPRYELVDTVVMTSAGDPNFAPFRADPRSSHRMIFNEVKGAIGEARGWTRDGRSAVGMGNPESGNIDMYVTSLATGASERLTDAPGYADPILMSPDDKWFVVLDNRATDRHMYYGGIKGIPPIVDQLTRMVMLSAQYGYRNGDRRFFQPFLIDRAGDRGDYVGQQLNAGNGEPGSISDPNWNARADPAWAPDGTAVVYWQALVAAPDCGGRNPLPCPVSTEPGGRKSRLMIARLPDRKPLPRLSAPKLGRITVPWGVAYRSGDVMPQRYAAMPAGKFTMAGRVGGSAAVEVRKAEDGRITFVSADYRGYTDDGAHVIDGTESAEVVSVGEQPRIVWHSDIRSSGKQVGTKKTSEPGGFVLSLMGKPLGGELVTSVDGKTYHPPLPGT